MWVPQLRADRRKYESIIEELRKAIEFGVLRPNDLLPPQRQLAFKLGVNLSTVTRAYTEAARLGLIGGETGRGTYVLAESKEANVFIETSLKHRGIDLATVGGSVRDLDVSGNMLSRINGMMDDALGYGSDAILRRAIDAARLWSSLRGYKLDCEKIILCSGAQAGLDALFRVLAEPRQPILCEEHTFPGLKTVARLNELRLVPVACDSEGAIPQSLQQQSRSSGAKLFVTVPNMQNPTGTVMSPQRRAMICDVVTRCEIAIVEDDVYGALCDQAPLVRDLPGEHIYVSSLSKCVAPGLKFGFLAGRHPALERLAEEVTLTQWLVAPLLQCLSADLIETGIARQQVMRNRALLQTRAQMVERVFGSRPPHPLVHLWLKVPGNADAFVELAREKGVRVVSSSAFKVSRKTDDHIRASLYGKVSDHDLVDGLSVLRRLGAVID